MEHEHEHTHTHSHEHTHDGVAHCHEHTHTHSHPHEHEHGHTHDHEHTHGHSHSHEHTHTHGEGGDIPAETVALLNYMAGHNADHAAELAKMGEQLRGLGQTAAADKIAEGVKKFDEANAKLAEALEIIKQL